MSLVFGCLIGGRELTIEPNKVSHKANSAVIVRYGGTVVLATVCRGTRLKEASEFVPLTVDFEERLYAAGKIPGSFFRREGRPSEEAILASRLTDRPLRPLIPKNFPYDIQIIVTVLSADQENPPNILSIIGGSASLMLSDIPFDGPVGAVQVGYKDGEFIINPTFSQIEESLLSIVVAGTRDRVVMLEGWAREAKEELVLEAIKVGHRAAQQIIDLQEQMGYLGKPKITIPPPPLRPEVEGEIRLLLKEEELSPSNRNALFYRLKEHFKGRFSDEQILFSLDNLIKNRLRHLILYEGKRPDGRGLTELRPMSAEVGILPRTHGSALFTRGQTQVLSITTLASPEKAQYLDTLAPQERKRFLHHYNFPPFSTGEIKKLGLPSRREIGHGALVERALLPLIPSEDEFRYTIRLVSEVLNSDGSTSMASVCASSLSLMDAGVPIKAPAAGVAIGLIADEDGRYALISDIAGGEDAYGDMDFKIAGSSEGITALQLDVKIPGISYEVIEGALKQALPARLSILEKMKEVLPSSRPTLSPYAPKMYTISIDPNKIGYVIGFGGKTIKSIIEETGASIDIEEDGRIIISAADEGVARKTISKILSIVSKKGGAEPPQLGRIYTGRVSRLVRSGAIVEIMPGREGLVPLKELAEYPVTNAEEVVKVGDEVMVKVIGFDRQGRPILSRKALFESFPTRKRWGGKSE